MRTDILRRDVAWDAATATLTVGGQATVVDCDPGDNECLLRTYLDLVSAQREIPLGRGIHLRRDDVAVLAELLDLDDVDLEARLRRMLHLSEQEAADLHRRLRRHRVAAAAVGVGLLAGVPVGTVVAGAAEGTGTAEAPPAAVEVVEVEHLSPDALDHPITVTQAAAAPVEPVVTEPTPLPDPAPPAEEPQTDIGHAVRYERDLAAVQPEGVDIGDAMVLERDPPTEG